MKTLAEDRDEMPDNAGRRWVERARRARGIRANEATCWFVDKEQNGDHADIWLGSSPGDALATAECYANNAAHRDGIGRWTLEVFGDGENTPLVLVVYPMLDEGYEP